MKDLFIKTIPKHLYYCNLYYNNTFATHCIIFKTYLNLYALFKTLRNNDRIAKKTMAHNMFITKNLH